MAKRIEIEYQDGEVEHVRAETWLANGFMVDFVDPGQNFMGPVLSVHHSVVKRISRVDIRVKPEKGETGDV